VEFWRWKHFQNSFGVSQLLVAANEEILGLRAFMRWAFKTPTGHLRAVRAVDTSTHPGYRRLGIFSRLTQASLERARAEGVNLIFNTPNAQSMPGYLKLGWHLVGRPRLLSRVLNPARVAARLLWPRQTKLTEADLSTLFRSSPRPVDSIFDYSDHVERIVALDDLLCASAVRTDRSASFFRWRYASAPSLQYFALWTGETPVTGLLIFRPNIRQGLREIMLCEFLIGYGAAAHARELFDSLARSVRADYIVAAATPGTQHWGMLRRAGFLPVRQRAGVNFTVLPLNLPAAELNPTRLENWRLSLGDLELF
jgi:GNAT superfamily N-acetyltransferase